MVLFFLIFKDRKSLNGPMTFSKTTLGTMALSKMTRSTISIQHNDITIMVLSVLKLGTMTIQHDDITTMVLSILTLRILTFSITLNFMKARLQYGDLHSRLVCFKAQKISPVLKKLA